MKRNITFFTSVISLLLLSSMILAGCMHAITADNGETKSYDLNGQMSSDFSSGNIVEDAPLAQTELQKKFSAYLHMDGNAVTVFSEEQYAELKAVRENDSRVPLTQEEILFLVNDSINLYFTYDEIRLTNSNRDDVVPLLNGQSGNDLVIYPECKDATAYNKMLTDIYEIIYYRIYMHDAGFETVIHHDHSGQDLIFGRRYNTSPISSAVPVGMYQMLAIDDATFSGIENEEKLCGEYKTLLEWKNMWESDAIIDDEHAPYLNSAVLYTGILNTVRQPMEYKFYIAGPKDEPVRQIYPTAELENMMPDWGFYQANASDISKQAVFALHYKDGTVVMSQSIATSFAMTGTFDEYDGVLKMYFGQYHYVFRKNEKGYVYSAENSKPAGGGFNFADGLVFEIIHEGVSTQPNVDPDSSVNNEKNPSSDNHNKNEYELPYFKLDLVGNVCSLMCSDGSPYADGTYVCEGDAYILTFDDDYRYAFYCNGDVGYAYAKGESNPISGYGLHTES